MATIKPRSLIKKKKPTGVGSLRSEDRQMNQQFQNLKERLENLEAVDEVTSITLPESSSSSTSVNSISSSQGAVDAGKLVETGLDGLISPTFLDLYADQISVDTTNLKVLSSDNLQELIEENDEALLNARATGIRYGGDLSDLGSGVVRISAGAGQILDITNPASPVYYASEWEQTDIDLASVGDDRYWIYVDENNDVLYTTTEPDHAE